MTTKARLELEDVVVALGLFSAGVPPVIDNRRVVVGKEVRYIAIAVHLLERLVAAGEDYFARAASDRKEGGKRRVQRPAAIAHRAFVRTTTKIKEGLAERRMFPW
jgi:hypothetical protein